MPSGRRTRGNPNPRVGAKTLVANPRVAQRDPDLIEYFGRDKDLKTFLKSLQPKAFTGKGSDVPKVLEEWIMSMDDYFALTGYNALAQGLMGRATLDGPAKLWWKLQCQSRGKSENNIGWKELKKSLKERYLPLNYSIIEMNEFLSCVRRRKKWFFFKGCLDRSQSKFFDV